jgi:hypothetical protein
MTYTPDHMVVHLLYRQEQLRRDADAYRRGRPDHLPRTNRNRRVRAGARRASTAFRGRIRRSLDSLTEWPRPI